MKTQILTLGKTIDKALQKQIKGGTPFTQECLTDNDCSFCHTCERIGSVGVCIGNC